MSTTFNKIVFGSIATFATVATLVPAQQANAAALKGSFLFDAQDEEPGTTAILTSNEVDFQPDENAWIDMKFQSGSFVGIEEALIADIPMLAASGNPLVREFLTFTDNEGGEGPAMFSITETSGYSFLEQGIGSFKTTTINLGVSGFFTSSTGDISKGAMTFSFDFLGSKAQAQAAINSGSGLETSFSGASMATVPEPATMAGLSMVAVGMALAGRRKKA